MTVFSFAFLGELPSLRELTGIDMVAGGVGGVQLVGLVGLFLGPAFVAVALGMLRDLALVEDDFPIDK